MHTASVRIPCTDAAEARMLLGAVGPEIAEGPEGTSGSLELAGDALELRLEGMDVSGLRAALHGALRLLDTAQRTGTLAR